MLNTDMRVQVYEAKILYINTFGTNFTHIVDNFVCCFLDNAYFTWGSSSYDVWG